MQTTQLIHAEKPQPTAEAIMKVLLDAKKQEEKYTSRMATQTNFRLLVINDLLNKIEKLR